MSETLRTLPPAQLRDPTLNDAVVDAFQFSALQNRIWRELLSDNHTITAESVRQMIAEYETQRRTERLSLAKTRQEQLVIEWKKLHLEIWQALERRNLSLPNHSEDQAHELKAEQVLQSVSLGLLLDPRHNLGQRRRSLRTQDQISIEDQHRQLNERIAGLANKK
jgi:hypothetical protein